MLGTKLLISANYLKGATAPHLNGGQHQGALDQVIEHQGIDVFSAAIKRLALSRPPLKWEKTLSKVHTTVHDVTC